MKISIIIPAYNAQATIKRCINSIISQTYHDIEIIMVDDGSTDGTLEIMNEFNDLYNNIVVLSQDNEGVSSARNRGLEIADGDFIMFVDSDDTIEPNTCEVLISQMSDDISLIIFGMNIFKKDILLRKSYLDDCIVDVSNFPENYWKLRAINLGPCNKMYRKKSILSNFDITLSLGEDTKFVIDYLKNFQLVKVVHNCFYNVNLDNQQSLNRKTRPDKLDQLLRVRNYEEEFMIERYGYAVPELYNEYFRNLSGVLFSDLKNGVSYRQFADKIKNGKYTVIYEKTKFKNLYYNIFAYLVYKKHCKITFVF